jgi:hypothetical protein
MEYNISLQTVVETPQYLKASEPIFSESEREDIVVAIASEPEAGNLMPGTGGYRKRRFGRAGMGKRGHELCTFTAERTSRSSSSPFTQKQRKAT